MKNPPQKLLIIGPYFFFSTGPAAQTSPELNFHIINMSQDSSVYWSVQSSCLLNGWTLCMMAYKTTYLILNEIHSDLILLQKWGKNDVLHIMKENVTLSHLDSINYSYSTLPNTEKSNILMCVYNSKINFSPKGDSK